MTWSVVVEYVSLFSIHIYNSFQHPHISAIILKSVPIYANFTLTSSQSRKSGFAKGVESVLIGILLGTYGGGLLHFFYVTEGEGVGSVVRKCYIVRIDG